MISQDTIDMLRKVEVGARRLFIDGAQVDAESGAGLPVISPIDGRPFASIADGGAADIDRAVKSARKAFEKGSWSRAAPAFRKKVLTKLAELIEKNVDELAVLGVRDNGTEINMAYKAEPLSA
ncbi:MAG: aldehyde dehydrogenase family protein, partial [Mesorhizobium sp.]